MVTWWLRTPATTTLHDHEQDFEATVHIAIAEGCGTPVAPHDGTNPATYTYDASTGALTIVGQGAYIGLPKAHNGGEDGAPVNDTITYIVNFVDDNSIIIDIEAGSGVWWRYNLVKN